MKIIERLKLELAKNELIYDFNKLNLILNDQDDLKYLFENLKPNTGYIKWHSKQSNENELIINSIENKLIINNQNYQLFPSDFLHCYLCYHCTTTFTHEQIEFYDQQWKIEEIYQFDNYTSILYVNELNKQIILAYKGIDLRQAVGTLNNNVTLIDIYSQIANNQIESQLYYSYSHLRSTMKLIKSKYNTSYSLSFTGAYYAALLADLSVYLAINIFHFHNVKSVTFESIGTFNYLNHLKNIDFTRLNLVTYLTEPNYLNICNRHFIGNQFRIIVSSTNNNNKYNGLKLILNEFNPLTGKPYQFKQIKEWPQLHIENESNNFNKRILNAINNLILIKKITSFNYNSIAIQLLKDLIVTTNFIIDSKTIIDFDSLPCLFDCNDFKVSLITKHELCLNHNYDLYSEPLNCNAKETSVNKLLYNLYHFPNRLELINNNSQIKEQLIRLRRLYSIKDEKISSLETQLTIEQIKYRLKRLELIDKKSISQLVCNKQLLKTDKIEFDSTNILQIRYNELIELKQLFETKQYVYIKGRSGSGKTILSKQYADLVIKSDDLHIIKWIQADHLLIHFIEIIKEFHINLNYQLNYNDYWFKILQKMKKYLNLFASSNNLNFLFIIDNLNSGEDDFKHLTYGFNSNIKFLITTQTNVQTLTNGLLTLNDFNTNQAVDYLQLKLTNKNECYDLVNLIKSSLSLMPIHLNKILKRINNVNNIQDYLKHHYSQMLKENKKSFEILSYLAYLNNDYISFNLIKKLFISNDDEMSSRRKKIKEIELKQCLNYLIDLSEISMNGSNGYSINKQTQLDVLKYYFLKENKELIIINNILQILNDSSLIIEENELFSHAIKLIQFEWKDQHLNRNYIQLKIKLALIYKNILKKHSIALDYLRQVYRHQTSTEIQNPNEIALTLLHIGDLYMEVNELKKSLNYYEKALDLQVKSSFRNVQIAETYFKIGLILDSQSNYKNALDYYESAIRIYKQDNNKRLTIIYNNIGLIYSNHNEYVKALDYFNYLKDNDEMLYLNNLAGLYYNKCDYLKSLDYLEQLLNIQQDKLATNDLNLALTYNNLAGIYDDLGDYSKALTYYKKSLLIEKDSLNHLNIACLYMNLGGVHMNQGEYEQALDYFEMAYKIRQDLLQANHLDLAICLKNISGVYEKVNDFHNAFIYIEEAIRIENRTSRLKHYDLAVSFQNLACIHFHQNPQDSIDKVLDLNDKSFQIRKNLIETNPSDLALLYNNYGLIYRNQMKYDQALESYDKALKKWTMILPLNHPIIAITYNNIACALVNKNEFKKALTYLENSLSISKESLQFDHPNIILIYSNITYVYDQIYLNKYSNN